MTDSEFEALVQKLDQRAKQSPSLYQSRVVLLAALGYGYVAAVVLGTFGVLLLATVVAFKAPVLGVKLFLFVGAFLWLVLRAMWVKLPVPVGRRVTAAEAPALFELLGKLCRDLRSTSIDAVLITRELNACIVQMPRLGLLGWHRNYLLLGLPLMKTLDREQFAAVLAHELGHLAGGHGRFANWIYRLRLGWIRLSSELERSESAGRFAFRFFFRWYVPYFNAYSFPLARANEYEADLAAARLTSRRATAAALTTVEVSANFLNDQYWPNIYKQAAEVPEPTFAPYRNMGAALRKDILLEDSQRWLQETLAITTSMANTHPSLTDRLSALGEPAQFTVVEGEHAADHLLEPSLDKITAELDAQWQDQTAPAWQQRFLEVAEGRRELKELRDKAQSTRLSFDERFKVARLVEEYEGNFALALQQLKVLNTEHPGHAPLSFYLGSRLLDAGDAAGTVLLESAIEKEDEAILPGAQKLWNYHSKQGHVEEADKWEQRWRQRTQLLADAAKEREVFTAKDKFEPSGLSPAELTVLQDQLRNCAVVRKAWLVKKQVKVFPHQPHFLLVFRSTPWWKFKFKHQLQTVYQKIFDIVQLPDTTSLICIDEGSPALKWVRKVRGSRVL